MNINPVYLSIWTLNDLFEFLDMYVDNEKLSAGKDTEIRTEYSSDDEIARF